MSFSVKVARTSFEHPEGKKLYIYNVLNQLDC